mmetsp:Transcript_5174/g.11575  ORF Transcript_5174/g.11575 Transcript_5174/m.11575 type:complete len:231 (-) Transcript_5174:1056-1748(-)
MNCIGIKQLRRRFHNIVWILLGGLRLDFLNLLQGCTRPNHVLSDRRNGNALVRILLLFCLLRHHGQFQLLLSRFRNVIKVDQVAQCLLDPGLGCSLFLRCDCQWGIHAEFGSLTLGRGSVGWHRRLSLGCLKVGLRNSDGCGRGSRRPIGVHNRTENLVLCRGLWCKWIIRGRNGLFAEIGQQGTRGCGLHRWGLRHHRCRWKVYRLANNGLHRSRWWLLLHRWCRSRRW